MTNSGAPVASTKVVNIVEYIHDIKEGEVKLYGFDVLSNTWVRVQADSSGFVLTKVIT